jgi:hypothetical protein
LHQDLRLNRLQHLSLASSLALQHSLQISTVISSRFRIGKCLLRKEASTMRVTLASIIALAASVSAVGNATVKNNSPSTFYLWSVGSTQGDRQTVVSGTQASLMRSVWI